MEPLPLREMVSYRKTKVAMKISIKEPKENVFVGPADLIWLKWTEEGYCNIFSYFNLLKISGVERLHDFPYCGVVPVFHSSFS